MAAAGGRGRWLRIGSVIGVGHGPRNASGDERGWKTARVDDWHGREVVLLTRIWDGKILRDHPELVGHLDAVLATVQAPDHIEPDSEPLGGRLYCRDVGPNRWLFVVVSFEQTPGRIITALGNRRDPKRWKP